MKKVEVKYTKTPLSYQITEYDCGQITFLNALRYLFNRNEIEPDMIKKIVQNTLDATDDDGNVGKGGTSIYAVEYLATWINNNSNIGNMKMQTKIVKGENVTSHNEELLQCLRDGGVAIMRVWQTTEHYALCTKIDDEYAYLFDPYYLDIQYYDNDEKCEIIKDRPFEYNRKVLRTRLDELSTNDFSFVDGKNRSMLLIKRV